MDAKKLQVIRQAEQEAHDMLISAEETTNIKIREANTQVTSLIDEAKVKARENEAKLLQEYHQKGDTEAQKILSELDRELSHIDHSADQSEVKAIAFLKEQMKVVYGN